MTKIPFDKLYLSKNERIGIYCLLFVFAGFIYFPYILSVPALSFKEKQELEDSSFMPEMETKPHTNTNQTSAPLSSSNKSPNIISFNPNSISEKTATQLGIPKFVYQRIQKYLATGARFKNAEQFQKIYGLELQLFNKLKSYLVFNLDSPILSRRNITEEYVRPTIDLNTATDLELLPIHGIGQKLANRIIKYRDLLGGFYAISQIKEVYGISDSLYIQIKDQLQLKTTIIKLDLANTNLEQLEKHPYIGFKLAKIIDAYIKNHEDADNKEILSNIPSYFEEQKKKLNPYLN